MLKDWEKSRAQLLTELRRLRKERDRLASLGSPPAGVEAGDAAMRLEALYRVTSSLADVGGLAASTPGILGELARCLGWDAGILWLAGEQEGILRWVGSWHAADVNFDELNSLSRQTTFLPGRSPLGHAWGNGSRPESLEVSLDSRSPRALFSQRAGLHWVCHFPLWHRGILLGFFEFFGSELMPQDAEHTKLLAAAGQQVVQRLLRERAEQQAPPVGARAEPSDEFAIIDLDARGRILRWGKDAERLKGFRPSEVIGKHVSVFYLESEEARAAENLEAAATRGFTKDGGWRVRRGQERFWADVLIVSRRAPHGEIIGYTKVVQGPTPLQR